MFTIVISEKGGAERRESFDKNEINVGRVQGNDLVLPKGNVSKHHARLLFRDARFIVTDLKSTNGTYVNGRKITQATIVREGDKIYIGDFVVRLDTGSGPEAFPPDEPSYRTADTSEGQFPGKLPVPREPAPGQPVPQQQGFANGASAASGAASPPKGEDRAVSHYPLERDPDDSDNAPTGHSPAVKVPAPPRVPGTLTAGSTADLPRVPRSPSLPGERPQLRQTGAQAPLGARPAAGAATINSGSPPSVQKPASVVATSRTPSVHSTPSAPSEPRRVATATLSARVVAALGADRVLIDEPFGDALRAEVDKSVRDQAKRMRDAGEFPEGVDADLVARDALAELSGLGPIESLIEDENVLEVCASGVQFVNVVRSQGAARADFTFSSNAALDRAIRRLAQRHSAPVGPGETVIVRALSGGMRMSAVESSGSSPSVLTVRRSAKLDTTVEELIQKAALAKPIASFLEQVLAGAGRVLVVGGRGSGASLLASAFARASEASGRALVIQGDAEIALRPGASMQLSLTGDDARDGSILSLLAGLSADPVIIDGLRVSLATALAQAAQDSASAFLVTVRASSLRQALARLSSSVARHVPGGTMALGQETITSLFDIAVEVAELADSKWRVVRVAELGGSEPGGITVRDIFTCGVDGAGADAGFVATGVTPRIVAELAVRGIRIDPGMFRRGR